MPLVWRPQMSVGNALIDADHRYLMCLINTVELTLRTAPERDDWITVLKQLEDYAREHFEREEKIQVSIRYLGYDQHRQKHRELMASLQTIKASIDAASSGGQLQAEVEKLTGVLRRWLLEHIVSEDMKFKPMLVNYPPNYAG